MCVYQNSSGGFNYMRANIGIYSMEDCATRHEQYTNQGNICAGRPNFDDAFVVSYFTLITKKQRTKNKEIIKLVIVQIKHQTSSKKGYKTIFGLVFR